MAPQLLNLEVLPDALSVKDVLATRHDGVFGLDHKISH